MKIFGARTLDALGGSAVAVLDRFKELGYFAVRQFPPRSGWQPCVGEVHDPFAFQNGNLMANVFGHAANLAVESLNEDDL